MTLPAVCRGTYCGGHGFTTSPLFGEARSMQAKSCVAQNATSIIGSLVFLPFSFPVTRDGFVLCSAKFHHLLKVCTHAHTPPVCCMSEKLTCTFLAGGGGGGWLYSSTAFLCSNKCRAKVLCHSIHVYSEGTPSMFTEACSLVSVATK